MATYSPIPSSTVQSATGASYTVASGFYAIAKCNVSAGGTFAVNSVQVLKSNANSWSAINAAYTGNLIVSGSSQLAVPSAGATGTTPLYANSTASDSNTVFAEYVLVAGDNITGTAGGGTAAYHIEVYPL